MKMLPPSSPLQLADFFMFVSIFGHEDGGDKLIRKRRLIFDYYTVLQSRI
jgi:hypothetical protein